MVIQGTYVRLAPLAIMFDMCDRQVFVVSHDVQSSEHGCYIAIVSTDHVRLIYSRRWKEYLAITTWPERKSANRWTEAACC